MPLIVKYHTFSDGQIPAGLITAVRLNTNWDRLYTLVNGMLDNDNIEDGYSLVLSEATAPAWSSAYTGKVVYAENTGYLHYGTGSELVRLAAYVFFPTVAAGALIYGSSTPAWSSLTGNATATKMFLTMTSSVPSWGAIDLKLDDLDSPDDNTDLNATTNEHGLLPKLSGTATQYLNGSGAWSTPAQSTVETGVGSTVSITSATQRAVGLSSYQKMKEIKINEDFVGTITVDWDHSISNVEGTMTSRLYFNGAADGSEKATQSDSDVNVSDTLTKTFVANDLIQIYGKVDNESYVGAVNDMRIRYKWIITDLDGRALATGLDLADATAVSTTNQDPI